MAGLPAAAPSSYLGNIPRTRNLISPRLFATGGQCATLAADFNDTTPGASTEIYVSELYIPVSVGLTGLAVFNGSNVTDNVKMALFDVNGQIVAGTVSTAGSVTDAYQRVPFANEFQTSTTVATAIPSGGLVYVQPGTYFVATDYAGTTSRFQTFSVGNFGAGKLTGAVFATAFITTSLTITPPVTFTTILGPVVSVY